jgi:hypothetical protein
LRDDEVVIPLYLQFGRYKPDWGDVPTWAAAVFALIAGLIAWRAFVVSQRAYRVAHQIYQIESERDERAAEERRERDKAERRAQADKVATWLGRAAPATGVEPRVVGANIKNASDLPVYDVAVSFCHSPAENSNEQRLWNPRNTRTDAFMVIPPHETVFEVFPPSAIQDAGGLEEREWTVTIRFRDAAGVRWERDPYGKLTEV